MGKQKLKCPFPYFGGKTRVAQLVWDRLGSPDNYVEPFAGSLAVLLLRPSPPRVETVNDADCMVANFWRATQQDPDAVANFADGPVNEADLHSRHRWLVLSGDAAAFRSRMRTDPHYFDPKIAGWWCWGLCCWIGGGWCTTTESEAMPNLSGDGAAAGRGIHGPGIDRVIHNGSKAHENRRPVIANPGSDVGKGVHGRAEPPAGKDLKSKVRIEGDNPGSYGKGVHARGDSGERVKGLREKMPGVAGNSAGKGIHVDSAPQGEQPHEWNQVPLIGDPPRGGHRGAGEGDGHRPQLADAYSRGRGVHGNDDAGTCAQRLAWLKGWFARLRDRLRTVRVCCGDWLRVCDSESVTTRLGTTGVFFDPPYSAEAGRDNKLYAKESATVAHDVRAYCLERGADPAMRIALAGYAGEGHEELQRHGWDVVHWKAQGGYGNRSKKGKDNAGRERLWFSPHCLRQPELFDGLE